MKIDDLFSIILRLFLALFVGAVIGLEREVSHKPAGLRTHMLVSCGSCLFILASLSITSPDSPAETSRTIQGIAAGVGFLGGGEILRSHRITRGVRSSNLPHAEISQHKPKKEIEEVRGLTSAAAIWVSAALGTLAGCGLWEISLLGALMSYLVLKVVKYLEKYL